MSVVVEQHQLRETKHRPTEYGKVTTEWECIGCGETFDKRPTDECETPTEWVESGCPGDGLGYCPDCGSVFSFSYRQFDSMVTAECPECGSHRWRRSDDGRPDDDEVLH